MSADRPTIRRRLVVSGRVQGVFYRDGCRQQATALGVAGSAANLADGSVEVVLEGAADDVRQVVEWARGGPDGARVAGVEVHEEPPLGLTGFTVG